MSYTPSLIADAGVLIGNPLNTAGLPDNLPLAATLSLSGSVLSSVMPDADTTTGAYEITDADHDRVLTSTDAGAVEYTLPAGLLPGVRVRSLQGGDGQISYVAGAGATILNTNPPASGGKPDNGFFAILEHLGDDEWLVTGNLAE